MIAHNRIIYLHGSESDSNSGKARLFREWFPGMLTPDFTGSFDERMSQLYAILADQTGWTLIGSSYGGLMGTVFTLDHPDQVRKLILLAPALMLEPLASLSDFKPVSVPTTVVHGTQDTVVPLEPVRALGSTGMKVARICLGCMGFGDATRWVHKWVLNEEDSRPIGAP